MNLSTILRNHGIDIAKTGGDGNVNTTIIPTNLKTTVENQKTWDIPQGRYDAQTDSMIVFHNTVYLEPSSYTLEGDAGSGYKLTITDAPLLPVEDNNVSILVFKNYAEEGSLISGTQLSDGSIAWDKLGKDIQDSITNAQLEIADNLTTDDNAKVLAASQGVVIKEELDKTLKTNFFNGDNKYLNLNGGFSVTQFDTHHWKSDTNSELLEIMIPVSLNISGTFKFTLTSLYNTSDASGGAEINIHLGVTTDGRLYHYTMDIVSMTTTFADNFYVKPVTSNSQYVTFGIIKRQQRNAMSVQMSYQTAYGNAWNVITSATVQESTLPNVVTFEQYPKQYSIANLTPKTTTNNMIIYASLTGSDISGNGSKDKPYRTVQKAIDSLPQIINHSISIRLMTGTYEEDARMTGRVGSGSVQFQSDDTSRRGSSKIKSLTLVNCQIPITLYYMTMNGSNNAIIADRCNYVFLSYSDIINNGSTGINSNASKLVVNSTNISERATAVYATNCSIVCLDSVGGSLNTVGVSSNFASTVAKSVYTLQSGSGDITSSGGQIR